KPKDKRCYMLTGHYGTGKSHLLLMMANFFSHKSDAPELSAFFENYSQVDDAKAKYLKALRSQGRYLVAICDYRTKEDFEEVVLRAIVDACQREGFEGQMDTHYHEAIRRLDEWEAEHEGGDARLDFFTAFEEELLESYPDFTVESLRESLSHFEGEALSIFKEIHRKIAKFDFTYDKSNLIAILKELLTGDAFKAKYQGLIVLFDEFGYTLQNARLSVDIFQGFGQLCAQGIPGGGLLAFISTAHKPFSSYSGTYAREDFSKVSDRIDEIELLPEGIEDVIAAIVVPQKEHPLWQSDIQPRSGTFGTFLSRCMQLKLFDWLKAPQIREKIIENVYPMHPMATYCLLQLSTNIGSANRTVFTFFGGEAGHEKDEGSYAWYVNQTDILNPSGLLNFYTADFLITYFQNELRSSNIEIRETLRKHIRNYENSLRDCMKLASESMLKDIDELVLRILRIMLVYEISGVKNTEDNIAFGLNLQRQQMQDALHNRLETLVKDKVLYFNKPASTYEFRQSEAQDFEEMIEEYKANPSNQPDDIAEEMSQLEPLEKEYVYLEAKGYNATYNEDKRMKREFVTAADFGRPIGTGEGEQDFFLYYADQCRKEKEWKNRYEGIALYVICQSQEEITKVKEMTLQNTTDGVIAAIPQQPIPVLEAIMNLRAAESIRLSPDFENFATQDKARLMEDLIGNESKGYKKDFGDRRRRYLEGRVVTWYGKGGKVLTAKAKTEHEAADKVFDEIFTQRNRVKHNELNLSHKARYEPGKNHQLRDAVNHLLSSEGNIVIDTEYGEDKGQIRYLLRLANQGIFRQAGKPSGAKIPYVMETDVSKYRDTFPAFADMVEEVRNPSLRSRAGLSEGASLNVSQFLDNYRQPPYGLGPISLCLFFAGVVRTCGDSIRLKKDLAAIGDTPIKDFDIVYELLEGKHPNAFILHKELSLEERRFLDGVYDIFSQTTSGVGEHRTVTESFRCIQTWWDGLPTVSKSKELYQGNETTVSLIDQLSTVEHIDAHTFLFSALQTVYGYDSDALMTASIVEDVLPKMAADKTSIDESFEQLKGKLMEMFKEVFSATGNTYDDIKDAIVKWYNSLDDYQRDSYGDWHSNESKPLIQHLKEITAVEPTLCSKLPASQGFGLGALVDWTRDKCDEYLLKLREGKAHIESHKLLVDAPLWEMVKGDGVYQTGGKDNKFQLNYRQTLQIKVSVPENATKVFLTDNREDPRKVDSQRQEVTNSYTLNIKGEHKRIQMVAFDEEGHSSPVIVLNITNDDAKHVIEIAEQQEIFDKDIHVDFVFPKDADSLLISARSLFDAALKEKVLQKDEAVRILRELLKEMQV
ncbi:hypothetical protein H8E77_29460, partial [bacterium]|nr:hypothetical protein [bacterium]